MVVGVWEEMTNLGIGKEGIHGLTDEDDRSSRGKGWAFLDGTASATVSTYHHP